MLYALLIYGNEAEVDATAEGMRAMLDAYRGYEAWLEDRGIKRAAEALYPTDRATTMRVREDEAITTDGPFAETKEQLGGFYLLECEHLDDALEAARMCPGSRSGAVEVRPVVDFAQLEGGP
ncbi:MAG: YciI family protein [Actinomycetota bacterium]